MVCSMKARAYSKFVWAFKDLYENLLTMVLKTAYTRLYNEAYPDFQRELKYNGIDLKLAPPVMHHLKNGRTCNKHLHRSFHHGDLLIRPIINNVKVGPPPRTSRYHTKPSPYFNIELQDISI